MGALGDAARDGRAAAMARRRALAAGRSALPPSNERVRTASNRHGAPSGAQGTPNPKGTASETDAVTAARLGRALSMQRRRQLSQGKQALNGGGDRTAAAAPVRVRPFVVHRGGGR
jgi:hypothetical protein